MQQKVNPQEALKKRKSQEYNKTLLIYAVLGIGIANEGQGSFTFNYPGILKNTLKATNDLQYQLEKNGKQVNNLEINLSYNDITSEQLNIIGIGIASLENVRNFKLQLSNTQVDDASILATCEIIQYLPQIKTLFLGLDSIPLQVSTLKGCLQIISLNQKLTSFTLSLIHNKLQDEGIEELSQGVSAFNKNNLKKLNLILISNDITSKGAQKLQQATQNITSLNSLSLQLYANKLGAEGAEEISKAMVPQLKQFNLDLYFNNVTEVGTKHLSNNLKQMKNLTDLTLNLDFNFIQNEGGQYLGEALKHLTQLKTLSLGVATKNFGTSGFEHIAQGLSQLVNLEELKLTCGVNKLGPFGIDNLKIVFSRLQKLKKLHLDYFENSLGDRSGLKVNEMFDALQNLEELTVNFAFNNLLEYGASQILKGIQKLKNLKVLKLDLGSNEIDDDSVENILKEVDVIAQKVNKFNFEFLNTAITKEVSEQIKERYQGKNNIQLLINSSVSQEYLEKKQKKKEEQQQKQNKTQQNN